MRWLNRFASAIEQNGARTTITHQKPNRRSYTMKSIVQRRDSLSFAEKLSRLALRLRESQWQRYGATMLAGKVAGVALSLAVMAGVTGLLFAKVYVADASALKPADVINPINTAWTLIAAFLVFGMQVGFTMLEA
jgi:Amt family ammonium transporter